MKSNVTGTWFCDINKYIACLDGDITNGTKYADICAESHNGAGEHHLDNIVGQVEVNPDKIDVIHTKKKRKNTCRLLKKNERKVGVWIDERRVVVSSSEVAHFVVASSQKSSLAGLLAIAVNFWLLHWLTCSRLHRVWHQCNESTTNLHVCQNAYDLIKCLSRYFTQSVSMGLCGVRYSLLIINSWCTCNPMAYFLTHCWTCVMSIR